MNLEIIKTEINNEDQCETCQVIDGILKNPSEDKKYYYCSTFTIDLTSKFMTIDGKIMTNAKIHSWLDNKLRTIFNGCGRSKIYFEVTKKGVIHAHGIHTLFKYQVSKLKSRVKSYPFRKQFKRLVKDEDVVKWSNYIKKDYPNDLFPRVII